MSRCCVVAFLGALGLGCSAGAVAGDRDLRGKPADNVRLAERLVAATRAGAVDAQSEPEAQRLPPATAADVERIRAAVRANEVAKLVAAEQEQQAVLERRRAEREQARDEERRREDAAAEAARVAREGRISVYRGMTPAKRQAEVESECALACDPAEVEEIAAGAATPSESTKLRTLGDKLREQNAKGPERREAYAEKLEEGLLRLQVNPDSVYASGREKRTLNIDGAFCSRQFLYDIQAGPGGDTLRKLGFRRVECSFGSRWFWGELQPDPVPRARPSAPAATAPKTAGSS